MNFRSMIVAVLVSFSVVGVSYAGFAPLGSTPAPCGKGGQTFEQATRDATFMVFLSDCNGNRIGRKPFKTVKGNNLTINIPGNFKGVQVGDVHNTFRLNRSPGEASDLDLESLVVDPVTNQVLFEGLFARIAIELGTSVEVQIPDLYADTDGNGQLGPGDLLYSLVDLHQYLQDVPTFSLGDSFSIVNGQVDALPGMLFSTSPFTYDPSSAIGFRFTPYDGDGLAESLHGLQAVPEPPYMFYFGVGVVALLGGRRTFRHRGPDRLRWRRLRFLSAGRAV